jgi:hypothetical protein
MLTYWIVGTNHCAWYIRQGLQERKPAQLPHQQARTSTAPSIRDWRLTITTSPRFAMRTRPKTHCGLSTPCAYHRPLKGFRDHVATRSDRWWGFGAVVVTSSPVQGRGSWMRGGAAPRSLRPCENQPSASVHTPSSDALSAMTQVRPGAAGPTGLLTSGPHGHRPDNLQDREAVPQHRLDRQERVVLRADVGHGGERTAQQQPGGSCGSPRSGSLLPSAPPGGDGVVDRGRPDLFG